MSQFNCSSGSSLMELPRGAEGNGQNVLHGDAMDRHGGKISPMKAGQARGDLNFTHIQGTSCGHGPNFLLGLRLVWRT